MDALLVTRSLDTFTHSLDPAAVPGLLDNVSFSFELAPSTRPDAPAPLYVLKAEPGFSIKDALRRPSLAAGDEDDVRTLRAWLADADAFARDREEEGDRSFLDALSCADDAAFTGALLFGAKAVPKDFAALGPPTLARLFDFFASCIIVNGIDFSGAACDPGDARVTGLISGVPASSASVVDARDGAGFAFQLDRLTVRLSGSDIVAPALACRLQLFELFGTPLVSSPCLELFGIYARATSALGFELQSYRFDLRRPETLALAHLPLTSVSIERAASTFSMGTGAPVLSLSCSGSLRFARLSAAFDPFSFGADEASVEGALPYEHLDLTFDLSAKAPRMIAQYRSITFAQAFAHARAGSFAAAIPHDAPRFACGSGAHTPESEGYEPIGAPSVGQAALEPGTDWYGIVFPVNLIANSSVDLLFAFSSKGTPFFGARFAGTSGGGTVELAFSSLFTIRFSEAVLHAEPSASGGIDYALVLRGCKVRAFGLQVPEGSCDVALVAREDAASGWYAVYGNGDNKGMVAL